MGGGETQRCRHGASQSEPSGPSGLNNLHLIGHLIDYCLSTTMWSAVIYLFIHSSLVFSLFAPPSTPSFVLPVWVGLVLGVAGLWSAGQEAAGLRRKQTHCFRSTFKHILCTEQQRLIQEHLYVLLLNLFFLSGLFVQLFSVRVIKISRQHKLVLTSSIR